MQNPRIDILHFNKKNVKIEYIKKSVEIDGTIKSQ
jgi:hypothetical protein